MSLGGSFELDFLSFLSSFFPSRGALGRAEEGKQARSNNLIHSHRNEKLFSENDVNKTLLVSVKNDVPLQKRNLANAENFPKSLSSVRHRMARLTKEFALVRILHTVHPSSLVCTMY